MYNVKLIMSQDVNKLVNAYLI